MQAWIVPWVIAALGATAALLLVVRLRAEQSRAQECASDLAAMEDRLRKAEKRAATRSAGDRRREDEVPELRRKLDKAKKRAAQARDEQLAESRRIKELEERLRLRDADVRAARAESGRVVSAAPPRAEASAKPAPAAEVAPVKPAPQAPEAGENDALRAVEERAQQARAQADSVGAELNAARAKLAELEIQLKRQHAKAKTQDKLYASMRLELEAKKDRLGAQQEELERLRALRVALMEPAPEVTVSTADPGHTAAPASD